MRCMRRALRGLVDGGTETATCPDCGTEGAERRLSTFGLTRQPTPGQRRRMEDKRGTNRDGARQRFQKTLDTGRARDPRERPAARQVTDDAAARRERLVEVYREASDCTLCPLATTRTNVVFGAGNADADLMFIGEAPGRRRTSRGCRSWGGPASLLNELLEGIGLSRDRRSSSRTS